MACASNEGRHHFQVWDSHLPAEFYGRRRDDVKLLTIDGKSGLYSSSPFTHLSRYLKSGDILVFNDSKLVPSSVAVFDVATGEKGSLHIGTSRKDGSILVEPRPKSFNRLLGEGPVEMVILGGSQRIFLEERHPVFSRFFWANTGQNEDELRHMLYGYGSPVTYDHVPFKLPMSYYNTLFSMNPGSSEFPSASRPFTRRVVASLEGMGVATTTLTLHCNLSPLEPYEFESVDSLLEEEYNIPEKTADLLNSASSSGERVIAVGTSVVRALESSFRGRVVPGHGVTDLFIRPGDEIRSVSGLITGLHDPESSHIEMISAFLDDSVLRSAYSTAASLEYEWHEFGDLSFIA